MLHDGKSLGNAGINVRRTDTRSKFRSAKSKADKNICAKKLLTATPRQLKSWVVSNIYKYALRYKRKLKFP